MTRERAQVAVPALIVGSENDQILVRDHFEEWRRALPQADAEWMEKTDHFLMRAEEIPDQNEYIAREGHVNEKVMRKVFTWIRGHWSE
jgi:pimeloyl-ACP methyl ester carboxylesterase